MVDVATNTIGWWKRGESQPKANYLGILYDIAAQNGMDEFPFYVKDGEVKSMPILENYVGEYTLPDQLLPRFFP